MISRMNEKLEEKKKEEANVDVEKEFVWVREIQTSQRFLRRPLWSRTRITAVNLHDTQLVEVRVPAEVTFLT